MTGARRRLVVSSGALAVAALGAASLFGLLTVLVLADPDPGIDRVVLRAAVGAEEPWLTDLALGPLDALGDPDVVLPVAIATAVVLAALGWWAPLAVLALGLAVALFGGSELKEAIGRERPGDRLDPAANRAFPSGHSRSAVFWLWLSVTVTARVTMAPGARRTLLGAGLAIPVLVGLARIYLRAHWLTDVLAGWAFAVAAFAAAALLVGRLGRPSPSER